MDYHTIREYCQKCQTPNIVETFLKFVFLTLLVLILCWDRCSGNHKILIPSNMGKRKDISFDESLKSGNIILY